MKSSLPAAFAALLLAAAAPARAETHAALQAVNPDGTSAWSAGALPTEFTLRGVWLTATDEWLATNYVEGATSPSAGGQFQVFVQSVDDADRGGTALFMAQRQRNGMEYSRAEWEAELARVSRDPSTGRAFRPGDIVEVTARAALAYGGKVNVNEAHRVEPEFDFDIALVQANAGLPRAERVTLEDFVELVDGASVPIFDPARLTGGEHWQGMRVRLDGVSLVSTNGWQSNGPFSARLCQVRDDDGRVFNVRHPLKDLGDPPARAFSVIGVVNQEGSDTAGYELLMQDVGPVVSVAQGSPGHNAVSIDADYDDWVLVAADSPDAEVWEPVDATPVRRIVLEDASPAGATRFYRLERRAPAAP